MENKGLTTAEVQDLLKENGYNRLKEEKKKSVFRMFLEQILNFTNAILAGAIAISIILNDYYEAIIMIVIVIANAIIGVVQEGKAQKALDALKKMAVLKATVIRDGIVQEISAEELVVGDYVLLEAGKQVPADLKLESTANLKIDEKALTGESVSVEKDSQYVYSETDGIGDRLDLAYMSTIVTYGRGEGIVVGTGMNTQIGHIADMVSQEKETPSPLQKGMAELSKLLGIAVIIISVIVFFVGAIIQQRDFLDMLITAVSLAVAAIPEGIPTIVTIVLALGMQRMAKINAIVKTMSAVETLGSVSVVCSDKTGTLTQNKMTVMEIYDNENYYTDVTDYKYETKHNRLLIDGFVLCTDASISKDGTEIGDPTEIALISLAKHWGIDKDRVESINPRINEKAFDSDRKLMTTVHNYSELPNIIPIYRGQKCWRTNIQDAANKNKKIISFTKGSTDELLKRCSSIMINNEIKPLSQKHKKDINNAMKLMSDKALRVLSLAIKYDNMDADETNLIYIGMVGMIDPERPEVKDSIETFKRAGIKTVMITGDHKDTALAIANKLGIASSPDECIMGHEIDQLSDNQLADKAQTLSIFARVSPEHKVRIVKAIQDSGNIVSMTGDGVNDAPSLKSADVGVAMGITGTDVAKGAADIILQDDKFTTIEKAIKEGRNIFENVKKSIIFALSSNISEVLIMFSTILAGLASPLKAVHILWINLITDSLPCFALGVDTNSSSDVMNRPPRKHNESILSGGGISQITIYSVVITILTICGFLFAPISALISAGIDVSLPSIIEIMETDATILCTARTYAFCILAISELFHAIGMRDVHRSILKFKLLDNKIMILAFSFGLAAQVAVTEIPFLVNIFETTKLSIVEWGLLLLVSAIPVIVHEILVPFYKKKK